MVAVTLPYFPSVSGVSMDKILTYDQRLASSIQLELPFQAQISKNVSVLNDSQQVNDAMDHQRWRKVLQLHSIPVSTKTSFLREYVLFVFQTDVLLIYRSKKETAWLAEGRSQQRKSFEKVPLHHKAREVRKVQELSIRALYALGLDYGMIKCGIAQGNQVMVAHINPSPLASGEMQKAFVKSVEEYTNELTKGKMPLEQIQLGADPEFIVRSPKGHLIIASKYLPFRGQVGCDAIWIGKNRSHKPLVEVRPDPTPDPRKLVIRIYEGLIQVGKKMNAVSGKWLAGALPHPGFPLGGHVHFSGIKPNFKVLRALDNYLALPFIVIEDQQNGRKRRSKYGFLGDYRRKDYGGFEYRTLPSWLVSPVLTKGTLALAKCIVVNYRTLPQNPLAAYELQQAYYDGDKSKVRAYVDELWEDLRDLDDYQRYQTYLEPFYRYLTSKRTWDENKDFRRVWRLPPFHQRK